MKDPNAKKPDDWDESQPRLIADPDAKKPATWKNDAPAMILDPSAEKPEEWDDNDEWTPDMIRNDICSRTYMSNLNLDQQILIVRLVSAEFGHHQ